MASNEWMPMERMDQHKYLDVRKNQPDLEVGDDPYRSPHTGWPEPANPVWGDLSDKKNSANPSAEKILAAPSGLGQENQASRKILGLSVRVFWSMMVLLFCILAAGVGGGVGAGLASKKASCSSTPTTTQNTTTTAIPSAGQSPAPTSLCSTRSDYNGTHLTPNDAAGNPINLANADQKFSVLCSIDLPTGSGSGRHDIMKVWTADLDRCVTICAEYNAGLEKMAFNGKIGADGGDAGYCRAVSLILEPGEFCYLKNGTGNGGTASSSVGGEKVASAILTSNTP